MEQVIKEYEVELIGSYKARCDELDLEYVSRAHGIIDPLARLMLQAGVSPDSLIRVVRKNTTIYSPMKISFWAGKRLKEGNSFVWQKYRERDFTEVRDGESTVC